MRGLEISVATIMPHGIHSGKPRHPADRYAFFC